MHFPRTQGSALPRSEPAGSTTGGVIDTHIVNLGNHARRQNRHLSIQRIRPLHRRYNGAWTYVSAAFAQKSHSLNIIFCEAHPKLDFYRSQDTVALHDYIHFTLFFGSHIEHAGLEGSMEITFEQLSHDVRLKKLSSQRTLERGFRIVPSRQVAGKSGI